MLAPWKKSYDKTRQHIKKQRHYFANKCPYSQSYGFPSSHVWMWELDYKESWALKNWCFWTVVLEKTLESLLDSKEIQPVHPKGDQSWVFIGSWNSSILATSCEELTHWKRPWCWEGLGAGGEGDNRGWDGWMASPTRWTWVWVNSGSWWWTGRPGVLRFTGSQRAGHDWATELNWTDDPEILLLGIYSEETNLKRYMHPCVNSQNMETTLMSINRWTDKEVVHINNGILLQPLKTKKNKIIPFASNRCD